MSRHSRENVAADSVQRALKVGTIVTGSVAEFGDKLRVKVDLTDASETIGKGRRSIELEPIFSRFRTPGQRGVESAPEPSVRRSKRSRAAPAHRMPGVGSHAAREAVVRGRRQRPRVGRREAGACAARAADGEFGAVTDMDKKWAAPSSSAVSSPFAGCCS